MTPPTKFQIGTVAGGIGAMVDLLPLLMNDGRIREPQFAFQDFSSFADLLDTSRLGQGYSSCTMGFDFNEETVRYALRQYCPGLSASVLINVPTNETDSSGMKVWHTFQAEMLWVTKAEDHVIWSATNQGIQTGLTIEFRALQQVA